MSSIVPLEHHSYDVLMKNKNPMALRLNDSHHEQIQVGDLVEYGGHNSIMDRQRFKVVGRMDHPSIHSALSSIEHSGMSTRDKIKMSEAFVGLHGPEAGAHPVVALQLAPHPSPNFNRPVGAL